MMILRAWMLAGLYTCCVTRLEADPQVYWSQTGGIWRGTPETGQFAQVSAAFDPRGLDVGEQALYWSDVEPRVPITPVGVIRSAWLDGTHTQNIAIELVSPAGIAVDTALRTVFWTDLEQHQILRQSLDDNSEREAIFPGMPSVAQIHSLAVDVPSQKLYFGYVNPLIDSIYPGAIGRMNFDGTDFETLINGQSEPWGIAIDAVARKVYWTDTRADEGGVIRAADLDGSHVETMVAGLTAPRGMAFDAAESSLYWVDATTGKLQRAASNGQDLVDVFIGLDRPQYVALASARLTGDFDGDGMLTVADVDALSTSIAENTYDGAMDLTHDGVLSNADLEVWVHDLMRTWMGDANLDGEFASSDLVRVFQAGRYETAQTAGWSDGDWNADLRFNSTDLVAAFVDGGYARGPRTLPLAVPEPSSMLLIVASLLALLDLPRRYADVSVGRF
jgi:hypothetical protein